MSILWDNLDEFVVSNTQFKRLHLKEALTCISSIIATVDVQGTARLGIRALPYTTSEQVSW